MNKKKKNTFLGLPEGEELSTEERLRFYLLEVKLSRIAIEQYGELNQASMLAGECGELIAALNRFYTQGRGVAYDVVEEMVDVENVISQFKAVLPKGMFDRVKLGKLEKFNLRIEQDREAKVDES